MRVLVVGAGASIEEARRGGVPEDFWPPTVMNFAEKMWDSPHNQFFNYWLPDYLRENEIDPTADPTALFIRLAKDPRSSMSVERLFEYCWIHKGRKFEGDWDNLIYHGVLNPLTFLLLMGFYKSGEGIQQLEAGKLVARRLADGDLVMNLNYDTLFEIAAVQAGHQLTYIPDDLTNGRGLLVAKPHGSLNLLADESKFWFSQPDCIGALPSSGDNFRNYRAIVPPRFNKTYEQHPIAHLILRRVVQARPDTVTLWGVGLADSDADLLDVYSNWGASGAVVEIINPDANVAARAASTFGRNVRHCSTLEEWAA